MSSSNSVMASSTTRMPFGSDTGMEALQVSALYASSLAVTSSLSGSRPFSIRLRISSTTESLTNTMVEFLIPPFVPNRRLYRMPFMVNPRHAL